MTLPYAAAEAAVRGLWSARWPHGGTYGVQWKTNDLSVAPDPSSVSYWLELETQFLAERAQAFGAGLGANEKLLSVRVLITVNAARGLGDTTQLTLLDDAVAVFRSQRSGSLSMIGDAVHAIPGPSADGNWWQRHAVAAGHYRFQG